MKYDLQQMLHHASSVYAIIGWLSVIILGVILGVTQKITVFRNYNDLGLVFLAGVLPLGLSILFLNFHGNDQKVGFLFTAIITASLILYIVARTLRDNPNPLFALIALITKLSLGILFILNFIDFIAPRGKTSSARARTRRSAFIVLLMVGPLVGALVKAKQGIFNPGKTLRSRGMVA